MLAFVLSRAVATLLLRCAPFAMLAVLSIVFFIAGPLDPD
jgi:hypothetical protein